MERYAHRLLRDLSLTQQKKAAIAMELMGKQGNLYLGDLSNTFD